ncbi:hypothetical protein [Caulobacter phage Kronos]|uniref:Uncharacterized protein n=1 Tax=Caulobacter phage Kronos TaxID=2340873 RepID=A0A386KT84_9CAUD|nr:hypothetical protein [Caulobacter phage Kronos]
MPGWNGTCKRYLFQVGTKCAGLPEAFQSGTKANMEQKAPAQPPRRHLSLIVKDETQTPAARFAACLEAYSLTDDEAAALLGVSRPVVARLRLARRPASQDIAARAELLFGIPAAHWALLPDETVARIKANRSALERTARQRPTRKAA